MGLVIILIFMKMERQDMKSIIRIFWLFGESYIILNLKKKIKVNIMKQVLLISIGVKI